MIYSLFHEEKKNIKSDFHNFVLICVNKIILSKHYININYKSFIR